MTQKANNPLIHIGRIQTKENPVVYLFLRQSPEKRYTWFVEGPDGEQETEISENSICEALIKAKENWKGQAFRTVICGFRYTLPERDEHGENALYYQMAASYASSNGIYLDEDLGHTCIVQNASLEARKLWERLRKS